MRWDLRIIKEVALIRPPKKLAKSRVGSDDLVSVVPMECLGIDKKFFGSEKESVLENVYSKYVYFEDDDVVIAKITPCFENGKIGVASGLKNGIGFGSSEFIPFRCNDDLCPAFLYHFMDRDTFRNEGSRLMTGAVGHKRIPKDFYEEFSIPIPPLEEQERIVEVLDEAFAAIDRAKTNIERNLTNARELFQSRLNDIFSNPSEDWEVKPLGEISAIRYGHTDKSNADFRGPKFLRITDIQDGVVYWESVPRCNPMTEQDWAKYELRKGDIVFARTGATTGKSFLLPDVEDAVFASYLIRVRLHQIDAAPFVSLFFESPEYWAVVAEGTTGSAQGGFNAKKLSSLSIPIPPREVQAEIIEELSELRRNVRKLEDGYQAELNNLEELRQSILEQAFEGKLTEPVAA